MIDPPPEHVDLEGLSPLRWRTGWSLLALLSPFAIFGLVRAEVGREHPWVPLGLALVTLVVTFGALAWPTRLRLLEDGVSIRRFGVARFVPYATIARAELVQYLGIGRGGAGDAPERGGTSTWTVYTILRLTLEGGGIVEVGLESVETLLSGTGQALVVGATGRYAPLTPRAREACAEIERRARTAGEGATDGSSVVAALMRGDMPVEDWRRSLSASGARSGAHAYRAPDASTEALFRVLENDEAPREARAGAAIALRQKVDTEGRERMRLVAESSSSPKLRAAVEAALDEDADERRLEEVLEEASRASPGRS